MIIFGAAFVVLYLVFGLGFRLGQASLPKRIIFDIDHMDEGFASTDPPAYSTLARRYRITPPKLSEGFRHIPGGYEAELTPQTLISRRCPLRRAFYERRVERFDELLTFCFQGHESRNLNDSVLIFSCLARDGPRGASRESSGNPRHRPCGIPNC